MGASAHNHDDLYLSLNGGSMHTSNEVGSLNVNFLQGYKALDFAFTEHTHSESNHESSKIELSNFPAPVSINTWTAVPGISLGINNNGNYLLSAQVGLQRSSTSGYCAARIKLGSTVVASAEAYGNNRETFYLSTIRSVTMVSALTLEIWSSVTCTSAIATTASSLSASATILSFFKL